MAARSGQSPAKAAAIRMNGYSADGIGGVRRRYSSFVPSRFVAKNVGKTVGCGANAIKRTTAIRIQNLQKLICCAAHKD
jgi:hypothetical protein